MSSTVHRTSRLWWLSILIALGCQADTAPRTSTVSGGEETACPTDARTAVSTVYDWHQRLQEAYRNRLMAIRPVLAAPLVADLQRAFAAPEGETFLDFDPFSGSQELAVGYQIMGCRVASSGLVTASVDVFIGADRSLSRSLTLHLRQEAARWVLRDITYPDTVDGQPLQLQGVLDALLRPDAEVLTTPTWRLVVERQCPEGFVTCDSVAFIMEALGTGTVHRAQGETRHTTCADGVSPCRFLGYRVAIGDTTLVSSADGYMEWLVGKQVVLRDQGVWRR